MNDRITKKEEVIQQLTRDLKEAKNFLESVIQSIGVGIIFVEMSDTIHYLNQAGEKILGYSKEELIGKPFSHLVLREKPEVTHLLLDRPDDLEMRKEGWMKRKGQVEFPAGYTINTHLNNKGETIGKIVIFRDLTNIYKIQEEILRMDRLVSLGKLASGIAHELRNPLAGIKTTAQALSEEMTKEDTRREYLTRITKEIDRLNDLLKTFFSFAKPQQLNLAFYPIKDIVREIIPFLVKEIADKGIRFVETYHPQLPKIKVDKNQLLQVFLNLFLNAIQAMPNGGELKIEVNPVVSTPSKVNPARPILKSNLTAEQRSIIPNGLNKNVIKIVISDTGKGIPSHLLNKIFDPFFTTKPKGIGLGLSIAYQIIKKHGGTIKVESKWEAGTSFIIHLPEILENV
jgi:PAS domain S-box-containing protein